MSQQRGAMVTAIVEMINRRELDGLSDLLHPQFVFRSAIGSVESKVYPGVEGMRAFLEEMESTWDGYRIELEELREAGERVVAVMRVHGTAKASGIPLDQRVAHVFSWREGKLWSNEVYMFPADALAAVGLE